MNMMEFSYYSIEDCRDFLDWMFNVWSEPTLFGMKLCFRFFGFSYSPRKLGGR